MTTDIHPIDDCVEMTHQRVNYFAGQFLEDKDFQAEQRYHLMRRRQLNQELFSAGVRNGFALEMNGSTGKKLSVGPGAAIDARGRELWLDAAKVLSLPTLPDGNYILCMRVVDILKAREIYSVPTQKADGSVSKSDKTIWEGDTRSADLIEFCMIAVNEAFTPDELKQKIPDTHIRLAHVGCKEARFSIIDAKVRDISVTRAGNGISIDLTGPGHYIDMQYEGKPNAFIGPDLKRQTPDCVTFSSLSKRMHLSGDEELYVLNKKGIVVGKEWDSSGALLVQGNTNLLGTLKIPGAELSFHGELKNNATSGVKFDGGDCRMHFSGKQDLHLLYKKGVTIGVDWDSSGSLTVKGKTTLQGGLEVTHAVDIQGFLKVKEKITFAGAELKARDGNSGVIFDSHANDLYLHGQKTLYISNKTGVVIAKDEAGGGEGKAGSLHVQGVLKVNGTVFTGASLIVHTDITSATLAVTDRATITSNLIVSGEKVEVGRELQAGSLKVTGNATVEKELTVNGNLKVPGARFVAKDGTMRLDGGPQAMHILGDKTLYLLQKGGVEISKHDGSSGNLVVEGTATVGDLKVGHAVTSFLLHSPGLHSNQPGQQKGNVEEIKGRLQKPGDFIFFVEPNGNGDDKGNGRLMVYWMTTKNLIIGHAI